MIIFWCLLTISLIGCSFALTSKLMPFMIRRAQLWNIIDRPDGIRKSHVQPTPRIAGVALAPGLWLGLVCAIIFAKFEVLESVQLASLVALMIIGSGVFLIGLVDDLRALSAMIKLPAQVVVCALGLAVLPTPETILGIALPVYIVKPLMAFWLVAVLNAVNLMDGLDGLTGSLSLAFCGLVVATSFLTGNLTFVIPVLGVLGCVAAFLRFNCNPAKVFLGDAGSLSLGAVVGVASLSLATSAHSIGVNQQTLNWSPMVSVCLVSVWFLDLFWAILRRYSSKLLRLLHVSRDLKSFVAIQIKAIYGVMQPDREHIHHRLEGIGLCPRSVSLVLSGMGLSLGAIGLLLSLETSAGLISSSLVWVTVASLGAIAIFAGLRFDWQIKVFQPVPNQNIKRIVLKKKKLKRRKAVADRQAA